MTRLPQVSSREVTGCIICVREIGLEFRFKRLLFIHVFRVYIGMDTRSVIEGPSHGGRIRQDYRERITVNGVDRYVMITSRMDLHEGSRTISIQSISMSPTDHWDLVEKLPEIFSRFSAQNFGDFQSWSDAISTTVSEVMEALEKLKSPWRGNNLETDWPRNFTFKYRRVVNRVSGYRMSYC